VARIVQHQTVPYEKANPALTQESNQAVAAPSDLSYILQGESVHIYPSNRSAFSSFRSIVVTSMDCVPRGLL